MSCKNAYFAGWGDCQALLKKTAGIVLQKKGETWTDATIITAATWKTEIADDSSAVRSALPFSIINFENTTDDIEIITAPLGKKFKGSEPIPSGMVMIECGVDDYNWIHAHDGKEYEYFPFFQGGSFWATRNAAGALKGFRVTVATKAGLPPEDKLASYPLYLFFDDPEEFKNIVVVSPDNWRFSDLLNYVPVGLKFRVSTAYTAGDVIVYCQKAGSGDAMTGLTETSDWEILASNATPTVAVTVVSEGGLGYYTLTIKKDSGGSPANLAAADYVVLQAHDDDATHLTYLSSAVKIYGGA
jgi:hypothetical protein